MCLALDLEKEDWAKRRKSNSSLVGTSPPTVLEQLEKGWGPRIEEDSRVCEAVRSKAGL